MKLKFNILSQPNETTCGPTCLHAVYQYYGDKISIDQVIAETESLKGGGALAVHLACHALKRGYRAKIFTYNLQLFDPTWFKKKNENIAKKLTLQMKHKKSPKLKVATKAYLEYLKLGGEIAFTDLTSDLIRNHVNKQVPLLTGLSSTYLYHSARENEKTCVEDDIMGQPTGHFVVLRGYNKMQRKILVADPYISNPFSKTRQYSVAINRVIGAILLGIVTYDANLLIIQPKR